MNNIKEKLLLQTQLENCSLIERRKESGRVLNLSQDPEDLHLCCKYQDHNSLTRRKTTVGSGRDWIRDYYLFFKKEQWKGRSTVRPKCDPWVMRLVSVSVQCSVETVPGRDTLRSGSGGNSRGSGHIRASSPVEEVGGYIDDRSLTGPGRREDLVSHHTTADSHLTSPPSFASN